MRDRLIDILTKTFDEQYEKRRLITPQHTAEFLIANGVTLAALPTEKGGERNVLTIVKELKAEAIKKFAERLEKEAENVYIDSEGEFVWADDKLYDTVADWCKDMIDKFSEEMTEG